MSLARTISPAAAAFATVALAAPASASGVDYGALEALFQEPVTTSATGAPQRVTEAPVNMTIISQEEIRRSGAIDIPGVLERAGLDVDRYFRGQADVTVRGYNQALTPRLLVLVNGRQVYLDHYGMTNWSLIPVQLSEIRQIEIVKGPNTALFGFNAVAGVVNILTYDALKDDVNAAQVTVGEPGYFGASGVFTGKIGERIGVRASLGGYDAEAWSGDDAIIRPMQGVDARDPKARSGLLATGIQVTPKLRLDLEGTWALNERTETVQEGNDAIPQYEASSFRATLSADTSFGMLQGQIYTNGLDVNFPVFSAGSRLTDFVVDNRITVGSASWVGRPAPAHVLRLAGEYRNNTYTLFPFGRGELEYDVYAVSGMWNWQVSDKLAITSALRSDTLQLSRSGPTDAPGLPLTNADYNRDFTEVSANVGAVWKLSPTDTLRLSYARGVGAPSLEALGIQLNLPVPIPGLTVVSAGDPTLDPNIVNSVELGWSRDLPGINGRLRAAAFWQKNEDFFFMNARSQVRVTPTGVVVAIFADNIGSSEAIGLELDLSGAVGEFDWRLSYAHRDIDDSLTTTPTTLAADFEGTTPGHIFTAGGTYDFGRLELGADARWVGETTGFLGSSAPYQRIEIEDYWLVNAQASYALSEKVSLSLSLRNLLEEETRTTSRSPLERAGYVTLRAAF